MDDLVMPPGTQTRLSCMHLRNNYNTGPAPDGAGPLYISTEKNGDMARLPTVVEARKRKTPLLGPKWTPIRKSSFW